LETTPSGVMYEGRFIPIRVMPVGIEPEKFLVQIQTPETQNRILELQNRFHGKNVTYFLSNFIVS
jgi:trehalose 6-phosphate synthase